MKASGSQTLIFYYFQLDNNQQYNVTALPNSKTPIIVRDVLKVLPIDLTQGLYHFRFKNEVTDGEEKIIAWLDINNLAVKAPLINGSVYVKILKIKENRHNKLFHIDKLVKADIIKAGQNNNHTTRTQHHTHHTTQPSHNNKQPNTQQKQPQSIPNNPPKQPSATQMKQPGNPKTIPQPKSISTIPPPHSQPSKSSPTNHDNFISFESDTVKTKPFVTTTTEQNLQTFKQQFKEEQQNRQNERLAQIDLQQKIKKWGYGHSKKINNTTTLLATLHEVWPEWPPVSLSSMLQPEQVTALFKKAVIKVHPDKNRNRHFKEKYLSKRVFELLNESRKQ